ncbi:3-isopropylmalate dehydratase [Mycolicibacterium agri]|uniref:3-isopropylmalate dehydratase small subunit n=1 Tax=Mycolicibacterium agri TaxID=36811 RepID=A0A2A7N9B2_MYCAG|nr:3-isopropylmalate dehydratase [Mycolicibacterium agri]PEG40635.1 3-isopropylmalate dehydratase [Mycolicibacterium agri]GFG50378.1 3-isopropylmalate dehydratase small subunit [Mycolicibacterium agri]
MIVRGRVQRFGADINTDYIIAAQHKAASLDVARMARHTFEDIDPGFVDRVQAGDVVVAGPNFGCGSSRETAPRVLQACGISAVVAPTYGRIFFRNAINVGLPVIECDTTGIEQDDVIEIDVEHGRVTVEERGLQRTATPLPDVMRALLEAGGLANYLRRHGDLVLPSSDRINN